MRVAIVHEWLVTFGGSERVVEQMLECFPEADVFSLIDFMDDRAFLKGKRATTSFVQKLPFAKRKYRNYLPLFPLAIEQFDLSAYDLVLSSSHAVAKGVLVGPDQLHISYVHSPIRYAWDLQHQYLTEANLLKGFRSLFARVALHYIRTWDVRTANGVDTFVANSDFIARRVNRVYRRDATVVYPPVDTEAFELGTHKESFYVTVSRMVPYKKVDLVVEAFSAMPERSLVVIGDGPDMEKIRSKAGPNVVILGHQPFPVLRDYLQRARAFVFAAEEDFGISIVEAQACGTPVIAFGKGGACETVIDDTQPQPTGVFFDEQTVESVQAAVRRFEASADQFLPDSCRANAERFSEAAFRRGFLAVVLKAMESHRNSRVWRKLRASIRPPVCAMAVEEEPAEFGVTSLPS
ncbi:MULTISPECIES: glycosyltransferase family 4 protein [Paraburkholderia]|uniref:Glycosyltransferase n=1 Tax=Paraburkholderia madseniana TaxID=2599607 RepID=A0A6N6WI43_9BURK|nr:MULTISPECIES: glycosyltransferase family 4 protein [Paraburkholderia]KAE8760143.1 glycosyltransferase [Paraburkholderia madseniana]MCX4149876.1 glycosyltransferase family 4 protein [Paraburkholderia madseniana]MDN7152812.1 glycosyltransferase family 4 protein [Paraburkholderia sp. WS6]MDQ6411694.1 glycosyltransferase family 4 protein [Paraburkholderia madseniana]NPT66598.1 glycosyltransferase [Paraburkholderia madseniana]